MKKQIAATLKFFHALFFIAVILGAVAFLISPVYDYIFCNKTAQLAPHNLLYYFFTYCEEWKPNPLRMKPYTGTIGYVISLIVVSLLMMKVLEVLYASLFKKSIKEELFGFSIYFHDSLQETIP